MIIIGIIVAIIIALKTNKKDILRGDSLNIKNAKKVSSLKKGQ